MAYTLIAHTYGIGPPPAISGSINTTGADFIIIAIADSYWGSTALTDSKSNTWIPLTSYSAADKSRIWLYYCLNPIIGAGHTFTATATGTSYPSLYVQAWSGANLISAYDTINGANSGGATTLAPGSITPAENNELIITALCSESLSGPYSVDSGFTITDQAT